MAAADADIESYIARSGDWLVNAKRACPAPDTKHETASYAQGSLHLFCGELFSLDWGGDGDSPKLKNKVLSLTASNDAEAAQQLRLWWKSQACDVFEQRLRYWASEITWLHAVPKLRITPMVSRWGSCSQQGRINLNLHLIKAPEFVLDEVLVHEICHLKEMNHGPKFYSLMDSVLPDWRKSRAWLKLNQRKLLADHPLWK